MTSLSTSEIQLPNSSMVVISTGASSSGGHVAMMAGYEIPLLFLLFMLINVAWEVVVAGLVFINDILGGRKSMWLSRTKEELLGLGVVSSRPGVQVMLKEQGVIEPTDVDALTRVHAHA